MTETPDPAPKATAPRAPVVAQGNYNGKASNYDIISMSLVYSINRPHGI